MGVQGKYTNLLLQLELSTPICLSVTDIQQTGHQRGYNVTCTILSINCILVMYIKCFIQKYQIKITCIIHQDGPWVITLVHNSHLNKLKIREIIKSMVCSQIILELNGNHYLYFQIERCWENPKKYLAIKEHMLNNMWGKEQLPREILRIFYT